MAALEWLDLKGNSISNIDDVAELQPIKTLQSLSLRSDNGDDSNPGNVLLCLYLITMCSMWPPGVYVNCYAESAAANDSRWYLTSFI